MRGARVRGRQNEACGGVRRGARAQMARHEFSRACARRQVCACAAGTAGSAPFLPHGGVRAEEWRVGSARQAYYMLAGSQDWCGGCSELYSR